MSAALEHAAAQLGEALAGRLALGGAMIVAGRVLGAVAEWAERTLPEDNTEATEPAPRFRCVCGLQFVHGSVFATHVIARHPQMLPPGLLDRTP